MDQYTVSSKAPAILALRPNNPVQVIRRTNLTNRSNFPGKDLLVALLACLPCGTRYPVLPGSPSPARENLCGNDAEQH